MIYERLYGTATTISFPLIDFGATDFWNSITSTAFAAGDLKISQDFNSGTNTATLPASTIGNGIALLTLTASEMSAKHIVITVKDQTATKEWEDQAILIETYGNASAQHIFNRNLATVPASLSSTPVSASLTANQTGVTISNVTTVATTNNLGASAAAQVLAQVSAGVDNIATNVTAIKTNTDKMTFTSNNIHSVVNSITVTVPASLTANQTGVTLDTVTNLNNLGASATAQINSQVDTALTDIGLDHLLAASVAGTDITDNSIFAKIVSATSTADWDSFTSTTDSLQAIRDNQTSGSGVADWTAAEKAQMRYSLGITGSTTASSGGLINTIASDLSAVKTQTDKMTFTSNNIHSQINTNTVTLQASLTANQTGVTLETVTNLNNLGASATAQINAQADTALSDIGLQYLVNSAVTGANVADNSIFAKIVSATATADWDTFTNTTDSLQGIRDNQTTGSGGGDWSTAEKAQIRYSLGITGSTTVSSGGLINTIASNITSIKTQTDKATFTSNNIHAQVNTTTVASGTDWTAAERAQIRHAIGVSGSTTASSGGVLQSVSSLVTTNLDVAVSTRSTFNPSTTGVTLTASQAGVTISNVTTVGTTNNLGASAAAQVLAQASAAVANIASEVTAIKTQTDKATFTSNNIHAQINTSTVTLAASLSSYQSVTIQTIDNLGASAAAQVLAQSSAAVSNIASNVSAIKTQTDQMTFTSNNIHSQINTNTASINANISSIAGNSTSASNLASSTNVIVSGATAAGTATTTQVTTNLTEATDDHYNGRIVIFTTGELKDQATDITDYNGTTKIITYTALTESPSVGTSFIIV